VPIRHEMADKSFNFIDNGSLSNSTCTPRMSIDNRVPETLSNLAVLTLLRGIKRKRSIDGTS
jgi:hypothetical protein